MKKSIYSIAQALLLMSVGINIATAEARPIEHLKMLKDGDLYLRTDITGGQGTIQLIDANTAKVVGLSSFDKTRLPAGKKFMLEQIRFAVAEVASTVTTGPASQKYSTNYADCPVPLLGAHFIIRQSGQVIIEIPVERLLSRGSVEQLVGQDGYYLSSPRLLEPEVELEIQIRFPDAGAAVAYTANKKQFLELHLLGPEAMTA